MAGIKEYLQSTLHTLALPFRVRKLIRTRFQQLILQNHQIIGRLDRLAARLNPLVDPDHHLADRFASLVEAKRELIDHVCQTFPVQAFADLGGFLTEPPGGYSFYAIEKYGIPAGFLVDSRTSPELTEELNNHPGLRFIHGDFARPDVAQQIGSVDAIFLFDVLSTQAVPTWQEVLEMYAGRTQLFLICNSQYNYLPHTVRLMDLGEEEYFNCIPADEFADLIRAEGLFAKLDEIHPLLGCKYRDCHYYWQWGMTDDDLIATMKSLGFRLSYLKPVFKLEKIKNDVETRVFIFHKK